MNLYRQLLNLRNQIDFPLRQLFRWKRHIKRIDSKGLPIIGYAHLNKHDQSQAMQFEQRYLKEYHFDPVKNSLMGGNYYENIFYLHMLDETFTKLNATLPSKIHSADIGTSHWFYVKALWSFYSWFRTDVQRKVELEGYEIDAYRIYADLHSRYDHAISQINDLPAVQFIPEMFFVKPSGYDVITMFFPFVFEQELTEMGVAGFKASA